MEIIIPKNPDLIELRADYLDKISETNYVLNLINFITELTHIPLLFTIRSRREGGEEISLNEFETLKLIKEVCIKSNVNMIDYELESNYEYVKELITLAKKEHKEIVLSYHNFNETLKNEELLEKLIRMENLGATHAKVAVMPNSQADVFRLLDVTLIANDQLKIPLTTMSMGEMGKVSRVLGWVYGSHITFAVGVESSAPGQIEIEELRKGINSVFNIV